MDNAAQNVLFVNIDKDTFSMVKIYKIAKEIQDKFKMTCEGAELSKKIEN